MQKKKNDFDCRNDATVFESMKVREHRPMLDDCRCYSLSEIELNARVDIKMTKLLDYDK